MRSEPVSGIQPLIIKWARESIGMSLQDVALHMKRSEAEIEAWENGTSFPSYSQLETLAYQVFKRPLAIFFLPSPPEEQKPEHEFRTLPDTDLHNLAPDTHLQIRYAYAFQNSLSELFNGHNPSPYCIWRDLSLSVQDPIEEQAIRIRSILGISMEEQSTWRSDENALKRWRHAIEDVGAYTFRFPFKQEDISGFCLVDKQFPVIFLNSGTVKTRQLFSLLHELCHLLLNINGIAKFGSNYIERLPSETRRIERFCNAVAADVLIPTTDFHQQVRGLPENIESLPDRAFADIAARYGVSRESILRRFLDLSRVSPEFYSHKAEFWKSQREGSGGNYYSNMKTYLSERFALEVIRRRYRDQLSIEQAADYLGVKSDNFIKLEQKILSGSGI